MALWPKLVVTNPKSVGHLDDPHYFPLKSYTYVIFRVLWVIFLETWVAAKTAWSTSYCIAIKYYIFKVLYIYPKK